jgi:hypothetical protein
MNTAKTQATLARILKKGIMNPLLRVALTDSLDALKAGDLNLAYQLTACKSYISGVLNPKDNRHAFQEDSEANVKTLGEDIYSLVDNLHHDIAFAINAMPSGMMVMSNKGVESMKSSGPHHVVVAMREEQARIIRESQNTKPPKARKVTWRSTQLAAGTV